MSIATAITTAQGRVSNAYTAVSNKGGTLPATQNLSNLPAAIESIPSGGGNTVVACAYGAAEGYTEGDKVLLNFPSSVSRAPVDWTTKPQYCYNNNGVTFITPTYTSIRKGSYNTVPRLICVNGVYSFSGDLHPSDSTTGYTLDAGGGLNLLSKSDRIVTFRNPGYYNNVFGFISSDYTVINDTFSRYRIYDPIYSYQYIYSFDYIGAANDSSVFHVDVNSHTITKVDTAAYHLFFFRENGVTYEVCSNGNCYTMNGTATPVLYNTVTIPQIGTGSGYENLKIVPMDATATYVLVKDSIGNVHIWKRSGLTWTNIVGFDSAYTDIFCDSRYNFYLFNPSTKAQYYGSLDTSTDTVTQLQNIFLSSELPSTIDQYAVDLDSGLALVSENSTDTCVIKNINTSIPYQYVATSPATSSYNSESLTGFVVENHGRNAMGYVTLTVETVEDPDTPPWSDIGIVFGMSITVNEGVV